MERVIDDVTAHQTWAALGEQRAALEKLWSEFFRQLASEAGVPAPATVHSGIAMYAEKKHADAVATRAKAVLGTEPQRFRVGTKENARHCVSLSI